MRREKRVILLLGFALALFAPPARGAVSPAPRGAGSPVPASAASDVADATTLYNAGTIALERDAVGPSVTFLLAAARLEPRAPDVRSNLANAVAAAARAAGEEEHPDDAGNPIPLSAEEVWWLAAAVLAVGAMLGIGDALLGLSWPARWLGSALVIAGLAISVWAHYAAWEESEHPEAVVIASTLAVERGPEEASRPAILLSAGERVRLGQERGGQVEVRLGANRIGWASRDGLWRVKDAPRYTRNFRPQ